MTGGMTARLSGRPDTPVGVLAAITCIVSVLAGRRSARARHEDEEANTDGDSVHLGLLTACG